MLSPIGCSRFGLHARLKMLTIHVWEVEAEFLLFIHVTEMKEKIVQLATMQHLHGQPATECFRGVSTHSVSKDNFCNKFR